MDIPQGDSQGGRPSAHMRRAFGLFAGMLEYPGPDLPARVDECLPLVSEASPGAAERLDKFRAFVGDTPADLLEELYTGTFDLQMVSYPYVGYQLFGESYKRGAFMVGLKEQYRGVGLSEGNELPDHLAVVLRFLAVLEDVEAREELVRYCLIPALGKMSGSFEGKENPYGQVILALLVLLRELYPAVANDDISPATEQFLAPGSGCNAWHTVNGQDSVEFNSGCAEAMELAGSRGFPPRHLPEADRDVRHYVTHLEEQGGWGSTRWPGAARSGKACLATTDAAGPCHSEVLQQPRHVRHHVTPGGPPSEGDTGTAQAATIEHEQAPQGTGGAGTWWGKHYQALEE